ncbi:amidohydrolase [candidate division LCP-89 bacterium B3_LCP]|uniref:Amidohydrolase n=1 Tax=candidate division LCP-89 bacterium B3_LCP TaxID=2012998 RepID=A0A532V0N4_UNCL8|nr:MAG: amidohydrolase [candidate division LCP-89 bacterium B3_LCP]
MISAWVSNRYKLKYWEKVMNRNIKLCSIMLFTFLSVGLMSCGNKGPADLILKGDRIYTMDAYQPKVDAVAIREGRIIFAGSEAESEEFQDSDTRVIDLQGFFVLPGLIDAHAHLSSLGKYLSQLDLIGMQSPGEIRELVLKEMEGTPESSWISGRGWDQNLWSTKKFPSWRDLRGTESHPVYLRRVDGHAAWVNKTVLDICGIDKNTTAPEGGKIIRDRQGNPTGVLIDNAINLVKDQLPATPPQEYRNWFKKAMKECNRLGLVGLHDAGVDTTRLDVYRELTESGELTMRIHAMLDGDDETLLQEYFQNGPLTYEDDSFFQVRTVKLYADGALGSRGAALLEPYSDDPGNSGLLIRDADSIYQTASLAIDAGFQVCTHAIGDAAVRATLDAYEKALTENPEGDYRLRVEHSQIIASDDIDRFAELKVIPSMQPTHATSDMPWAEDRLGPDRIKGAYAWRQLLNRGCKIPCGSDFPVESPNPLWGIYAAATRQDHQGQPPGGWYPQERMTVEEAVRGFTIDAAYAEFAEDIKGSIEVGKLADFTIVDRDIFRIPRAEILETKVVGTIVGGKIVYADLVMKDLIP